MKRPFFALFLFATALFAADEPKKLTISLEPLGDNDTGVVTRITFKFELDTALPEGVPLVIVGSTTQNQVKPFRYLLSPTQKNTLTAIQTLQPGEAEIEARLMVPLEEQAPAILAKSSSRFTIAKTDKPYVANLTDGAEAIVAEGTVPELGDAVKIIPPRRDIAPNLFIIDVDVKAPVKRVEFWVEGKKVMTRNGPPYRAELDLGKLPKRVEVRAIGYDDKGHYVDADSFVVNEHETPLEVKITRTDTPDKVAHVKLSVQNPKGRDIKSVVLFADQKKIMTWSHSPYAIDIPGDQLTNVRFLRASVVDDTNYEAADLMFLNGATINEEMEVNLIELPVAVTDSAGLPISGLKQSDFVVKESGKPQSITNFDAASNLPLSVGLLIDHSGSMKPRMEATRKAAAEFLSRIIKPKDQAFVAGFSFDATKQAPFVSDVGSLEDQVRSIPDASGGTSLYDAIITGLYRFRNLQGRKALIILTDGEDTTSRITYDDMLQYARASRVPLYFIGIALGFTDIGGTNNMKALAAETGAVAYFIKDAKALDATYAQLEKELRSQYLIAYNTQSSKTDKQYRPIEVTVNHADAHVRTIRGFLP